jgi:hypothetical protein
MTGNHEAEDERQTTITETVDHKTMRGTHTASVLRTPPASTMLSTRPDAGRQESHSTTTIAIKLINHNRETSDY